MSTYSDSSVVESESDPDHDNYETSDHCLRQSEEKAQSYETRGKGDESTDRANDALPMPSTMMKDGDNHSIESWDKTSYGGDEHWTADPPRVLPLGLSRRSYFSDYNDYDVITVHGARDDPQTAWTSSGGNLNWVERRLFPYLSVRQLDYVYDTGNSARIYDSGVNGIAMEANALLDSLARHRDEDPPTEKQRPIIWICHDLGGTIVKQALINAIHNQPESKPNEDDDPECTMRFRKIYRKIPVLTSSIIFIACPHGNESKEELEDQLLTMISLPGPRIGTQIRQKIVNLSRQIESVNLEFLETKVLDRAVVINITTEAEDERQLETTAASTPPTNAETPVCLFSMHKSAMLPNLAVYSMMAEKQDHLLLVRAPDHQGDWTSYLCGRFNDMLGYNVRTLHAHVNMQNALLSLSPPTQVNEYRFRTEGSDSTLLSWIIEHNVFERHRHQHFGSKTMYLHAGSRVSQIIDMNLVSRHLYTAYDLAKRGEHQKDPSRGCFYFEFSQHDSRRSGMKAMIISFLRTYACRFWRNDNDSIDEFAGKMNHFKTWSLQALIPAFLELDTEPGMKSMTIILGRIDQCDNKERHVFLQALLERQKNCERAFDVIVTTTRPEDSICGILPQDSTISLDDCPLLEDEYLAYPDQCVAANDRTQRLLDRRPEFADLRSQVSQIFGKFNRHPSLQEKVLEWLANYRSSTDDEPSNILQEAACDTHQKFVQSALDQVSGEKQRIMAHIFDWIAYAAEPLTVEILSEAMKYSLPEERAWLQHLRNHEDFSGFVEQLMGGIIVRDGRDLKFSDEVFYTLSGTGKSQAERDQTFRSHAGMATACLRYLLAAEGQEMLTSLSVEGHGMDDLDWTPITLPRHSLVSYALRFWTVHYRAAGDYRPSDLATELLQDISRRGAWIEAAYVISNTFTRIQREYIGSLPYMAMFGLDDLVHREIENKEVQFGWDYDCWLAIIEAARNGHGSTVALLLEHTGMDAAGLREALIWAARYGEGEALDCLISKAQRLENFSWPPGILDLAIVANLENLVLALLQAGYDLSEEDWQDSAIIAERECLLKIILNSGLLEPGPPLNGVSSLLRATRNGNPMSVQHLIDAGVIVENVEDMAALFYEAIRWGSHKALEVLIDAKLYPIDLLTDFISSRDYLSDLAILLAVKAGHHECTRVLLNSGIDPNFIFDDGTALYHAIASGPHLEVCRVLLEKGADPNEPTAEHPSSKQMVLNRAIETGKRILVEMLLDHGAKINVTDPNHYNHDTPLGSAIRHEHYDIMEMLLERGADPNLVCEDEHYWSPLFTAANLCCGPRYIETLIKHGANANWSMSGDGQWSVLHAAYDSADSLSLLLKNGADINATKEDGRTVLILAAENRKKESVEFLLKQTEPKADLEVAVNDDPKPTALHLACERYDADILKMLLEAGADINHQESNGESPLNLLLAFNGGKISDDSIAMILKWKPNLELSSTRGDTVLHMVRSETPLPVVMRLVEEGAPVNTLNDLGHNPLASAVFHRNWNVARYLTTVKGVNCNLFDPTFGSILNMAAEKSTLEVVRQLVRTGAEPNVVDPAYGEPVLYSALENEDHKHRRQIVRYLVEKLGVDVNAVGRKWRSPLLRVLGEIFADKSILKFLLRQGVRTDQTDDLGRTAAHLAAANNNIDQMKLLVAFGADLSVADNFGRTPLHFACKMESREHNRDLVQYMLEKLPNGAADINITDVDGWTPLMWACKSESAQVLAIELIENYKADVRVRSKDGKWSPLKVAALNNWYEDALEDLEQRVKAQGVEESLISQDREMKCGISHFDFEACNSCSTDCWGPTWICRACEFRLCFKCFPHSASMHNPEHTFVDLDEDEKGSEGSYAYPYECAYGGKSGTGSDNEEETESESEEDEEEEDSD